MACFHRSHNGCEDCEKENCDMLDWGPGFPLFFLVQSSTQIFSNIGQTKNSFDDCATVHKLTSALHWSCLGFSLMCEVSWSPPSVDIKVVVH